MPRNADLNPVASGLLALASAGNFSSLEESVTPVFDCQSCGACCSYSAEWPRFSTEDDAQLDLIPQKYVAADESGMRCDGVRCSALAGEVGKSTICGIYEVRPNVCRACMPGGDDCLMARKAHGLPTL
ncbi:MAG: YkgJ family cysteine cluster protein [Mesorhizobium sp.]|uniref:YkgJ family cysteine cluster protein n=1 Tax=Mesorhizobium sp. TaxID=1871066 RepID=UPI000FE759C0|nr:YkgJ family cysteine cluster protein [Mesorhizobium sp.]RWH74082.1 MAG: YkgJ family cysteine cluster protein [Mesorhizobium sp.]RWH84156.1 MAG: YkgJ family cysteine cluster protein [Mesorhizobium sp.]RWH90098.1 MAG: YkgJ family cysteine cluster protein [Mesorhizobium sp.]RWH93937.1 MAG: YkgJ family cysteine cluster protein [Mesorhizobium sp.]RWI05119.1 MAG: YkgJ family cysteine cluster protein [Mesorhizobium sp.]